MYPLKYVNSKGEEFDMMSDYAFYSECGIRDWRWSWESNAGAVTRLYRDMETESVPVMVTGTLEDRDRMADVFDRDAALLSPGTLWAGEWQRRCFAVESSKASRWVSRTHMEYEVSFLFVDPMWARYVEWSFPVDKTDTGGKLGFPFDFPFDLGCGRLSKSFVLDAVRDCNFRLTVYGDARSPYVVVGGNTYQVNCDLSDGDILVVDSRLRKIEVTTNLGDVRNAFDQRARGNAGSGSFVFEKVKPGYNSVSWDNTFGFDIGCYIERNEPSWT